MVIGKARNEGNMIIIKIGDDGNGIDVEVVKKTIDMIIRNEYGRRQEAFNLIFEPGFSTATKITNISERGVGADVVRKQIELNGNVSIWSEKGRRAPSTPSSC